jgi:hypothetical protein
MGDALTHSVGESNAITSTAEKRYTIYKCQGKNHLPSWFLKVSMERKENLLKSLTLLELKALCKDRNLSTTGTKLVLARRLVSPSITSPYNQRAVRSSPRKPSTPSMPEIFKRNVIETMLEVFGVPLSYLTRVHDCFKAALSRRFIVLPLNSNFKDTPLLNYQRCPNKQFCHSTSIKFTFLDFLYQSIEEAGVETDSHRVLMGPPVYCARCCSCCGKKLYAKDLCIGLGKLVLKEEYYASRHNSGPAQAWLYGFCPEPRLNDKACKSPKCDACGVWLEKHTQNINCLVLKEYQMRQLPPKCQRKFTLTAPIKSKTCQAENVICRGDKTLSVPKLTTQIKSKTCQAENVICRGDKTLSAPKLKYKRQENVVYSHEIDELALSPSKPLVESPFSCASPLSTDLLVDEEDKMSGFSDISPNPLRYRDARSYDNGSLLVDLGQHFAVDAESSIKIEEHIEDKERHAIGMRRYHELINENICGLSNQPVRTHSSEYLDCTLVQPSTSILVDSSLLLASETLVGMDCAWSSDDDGKISSRFC